MPWIGITNQRIAFEAPTIFQLHNLHTARLRFDALRLRIPLERYAMTLAQSYQSLDQRGHATAWKPNAPFALKIMNEAVNTRCIKWIASHQQGLYAESTSYALVGKISCCQLVHRTVSTQAHHGRHDTEHGSPVEKGLRAELNIAFLK